ncbi:glycoside hydrolase family 3 N-terminal domain-containing protein [Lentzea sp. BCCO 10_0798]|uniref:Glycoside hydrolase family 3 N-terminal domain-containing protein n=1 Tax=Lentzea kristufekii TaxID=3095430 RepID=A0ABU4TSN9_9PSEU|nr:glycoside hydrolase family 3 N-terminal domain-containing protein [Lentzea sp. BCCO 10_0798]MDX8051281.1 glycoside hydrolase family 3 N-terminal domain-containing protein [Lentzea sp. BCCO 10_0798]
MDQLAAAVLLPGFTGTTAPDWLLRRVADGLGGVVLFGRNVVDDAQVTELCTALRSVRPDVVIGIDEEGGDVTRLDAGRGSEVPGNHALGAADDLDLTRSVAASIGARLAKCGISLNLAPSADLVLTLDDPIIGVRAFGSDPVLAARHVAAWVEGLQAVGVAACAKHFPGHGASTEDSHEQLPVLPRTEEQLRAVELVPFQAAVNAGVRSIMTGHLVIPEWGPAPVTLNKHAIDLLRTELGFTGAVITDGLDMKAVGGDLAVGAVRALAAGVDSLCLGGMALDDDDLQWLIDSIVAAVKSGELSEERLTQAAARSLALGLPPSTVDAHDAEIGLTAARRAVSARGRVSVGADPVVVDLVVDSSIAVGDVPWGLGPYLQEVLPGTEVIAARDISAEEVAKVAGDRTIVVVTRDAHRHSGARQLVTNLTNLQLDVVHVETGVPGPDLGSVARIDTHGGSRVSLRAAAELILKGTT